MPNGNSGLTEESISSSLGEDLIGSIYGRLSLDENGDDAESDGNGGQDS